MTNKKSETFNEIYTSTGSWIDSFKNKSIIENAKTVIVIQDCYQALKLALTKKVIYITFDKDKCDFFNTRILINTLFGGDDKGFFVPFNVENREVIIENILKEEGFNENMKADLIIGNPPYEGNGLLYLKILKAIKKFAIDENVIWLCPSNFCDTIYNNFGKIAEEARKYKIYNMSDCGNPFSDASVENVSIFHFNINGKDTLENVWQRHYKNPEIMMSILNKITKYQNHIYDKGIVKKDNNFDWYCGSCNFGVRDRKSKNWLDIFTDPIHISNKVEKSWYPWWNFKTKNECENFVNYGKSVIFKFAWYIIKYNYHKNENLKLIPFLNDYTHPWTDEMICKELCLTEKEYNYICKEMKPYK